MFLAMGGDVNEGIPVNEFRGLDVHDNDGVHMNNHDCKYQRDIYDDKRKHERGVKLARDEVPPVKSSHKLARDEVPPVKSSHKLARDEVPPVKSSHKLARD
jgi:hypothetical protein